MPRFCTISIAARMMMPWWRERVKSPPAMVLRIRASSKVRAALRRWVPGEKPSTPSLPDGTVRGTSTTMPPMARISASKPRKPVTT